MRHTQSGAISHLCAFDGCELVRCRRVLFCAVFLSVLFFPPLSQAQTPSPATTQKLSQSQPGLAPDDVISRLSGLVHAEKYAEAKQLIPGLLKAYPDDQRLVKANALLDKLLSAVGSKDKVSGDGQQSDVRDPSQPKPKDDSEGFVGIGAQMEVVPEAQIVRITGVFPDSPAARAGLSAGVIVDKVDGVSVRGKSLEEVAKAIRGDAGTQVSLNLIDSGGVASTVVLTRQKIQPADDADPSQLTGMERVDYSALIELARQAQQTTDLSEQQSLLTQFMLKSGPFLQKHPKEMLLWQFRAVSAITLNNPWLGYEAGQKLLVAGAANSNDPGLQQLLGQLKNKGWLDRHSTELAAKQAKYDWLVGTWTVTWSESWPSRGVWPFSTGPVNGKGTFNTVEITVTATDISGYDVVDGAKSFHVGGHILESGEIKWSWYLAPSGNFPGYHTTIWGRNAGEIFYPSGWQPVISCQISGDRRMITMVVPSQDTNPKSADPMRDTVTLVLRKD